MAYQFPVKAAAGVTISSETFAQYSRTKAFVATVATANIAALENIGSTINGHTVAAGDRILVTGQSSADENGVYVAVDGGAWTRATDFASTTDSTAVLGAIFTVSGGYYAGTSYRCTNSSAITFDTTNVTFALFGEGYYKRTVTAANLVAAGATMALDIALFTVPAGGVIPDGTVQVRTAATISGNLNYNLGWTATDYTDLLAGIDLKAQTERAVGPFIPDDSAAQTVYLRVFAAVSNLSTVTGLDDGIEIAMAFRGVA